MSKNIIIIAAILCTFIVPSRVTSETLPLATAEWPPYTSISLDGHGYVVEYITEVVREMGMEPEIRFYPWARAQKVMDQANVFGGFPFGITAKRQGAFDFSDIFLKTRTMFFYHRKKIEHLKGNERIEKLKNYSVGVIRESKTLRMLEKSGFHKITRVDSVEQSIQMLKTGRVQLAALVEHSGRHYINILFPEESDHFGAIPFYNMEAAVMISTKYPDYRDLLQRFNKALKVIESRGTMDKLLKKYKLHNP